MTRELCVELNISFSVLEMTLAMLEYHKICTKWVSQMLTQKQKDYHLQVCQDLLNQYEDKGDKLPGSTLLTMLRCGVITMSLS